LDGEVHLNWEGCFNRFDPLQALLRESDNGLDVLVREKYPHQSAGGSWGYNVRLCVGQRELGETIHLFYQDFVPAPVEEVDTAEVVEEADECASLIPCGVEIPCENEGIYMDEIEHDYMLVCAFVDSCGDAFCTWDGEVCMLECCSSGCSMLDSYPLTPECE
jgi:hypothetical protein